MIRRQLANAAKFIRLMERAGKSPTAHFKAIKLKAPGYMDLCVDQLMRNPDGSIRYAFAHYGKSNGDLMADPDMEMTFQPQHNPPRLVAETYQNAWVGVYAERNDGSPLGDPESLDVFLGLWLSNLLEQGHV